MLYLRALTLKDFGTKKEPRLALRCDFGASHNKYAKTYPVNVFKDSGLSSVFAALQQDFKADAVDETIAVDCKEEFAGELFTADVAAHYVTDSDGSIIERDGEKVISTSLTTVFVEDFGQTRESVIRSYERTWEKNDLLCQVEEED